MNKVYVVTGASSGIGLSIAQEIINNGNIVYSLSRSAPNDKNIKFEQCDVQNRKMIESALLAVYQKEGRIDCVINNAGIGISGSAECEPEDDIKKIVDINFTGAMNVACCSLPYLRESKGMLINIGSIAGVFAIPFQSFYSATKAGLQNFSNALRNEMRPLGVKVCCVLPCDTKTDFTKSRIKVSNENDVYAERVNRSVMKMEKDEQNGMSPSKVAKTVYKLSNKKNPPATKTMGGVYKLLMFVKRIVPERFINFVLYKMYGE